MEENQRRNKLPHNVIVKAPGLLPMLYTPRELSEELNLPESTLRDWLEVGAPHQRDQRNRLWINGVSFAGWVDSRRKTRHLVPLSDHEAYCLHCNQVSTLISPSIQPVKGNLVLIKGTCNTCGKTINRGVRHDRTPELPQN